MVFSQVKVGDTLHFTLLFLLSACLFDYENGFCHRICKENGFVGGRYSDGPTGDPTECRCTVIVPVVTSSSN